MQSKLIHQDEVRSFVLAFGPGDEVLESLERFAQEQQLSASSFTGIGAFSRATLGFFDLEQQGYEEIPVNEQVEVLVLAGNVALHEGAPKIHAHAVLGRRDGTTLGGHLLNAYVQPTLEVMLRETPVPLQREIDAATGLPLLNLNR